MTNSPSLNKICLSKKIIASIQEEVLKKAVEKEAKTLEKEIGIAIKKCLSSPEMKKELASWAKDSILRHLEDMDSNDFISAAFSDREWNFLFREAIRGSFKQALALSAEKK